MRPTAVWLAALVPLIPLFLIPLFIPLRHLHLPTSLMSVPTAVHNQDSLTVPATIKTPVPLSGSKKSQGSRQRFLSVWPRIRGELEDVMVKHNMPKDAQEWFKNNLEYNTPGGKLNRGVSVIDTVEILRGRPLDDNEYYKPAVLGWAVELLQAYFLVADDMMDASVTRRGQPCWYRNPHVGTIAINDSFMLEAAIYHLLKIHFRTDPYYVYLLELFLETTFKTEMGQLIDLITAPEDVVDLSKFSLDKHRLIVIYKTAYYSFYLPVALAMRYAGITSDEAYALALSILIPMGEYFQVQDDYLDCYGGAEKIGKIGTDILDNKCSWCINTALKKADARQRKILDENYGRKDPQCEARVKEVFDEIQVQALYFEYEQQAYEKLCVLIDSIPEEPSPPVTTLHPPHGHNHEDSPTSSAFNTPDQSRSSSPELEGTVSAIKGKPEYGAMLEPYPTTIPALHGGSGDTVTLRREVFKSFLEKIYKRSR